MEEIRLRPYKKEFDFSYTLGVFPTLELISSRPDTVKKLLLSPRGEGNEGVGKIMAFAEKSGIPALFEPNTLSRISSKDNCFAAGVFRKYACSLRGGTNHLVLVNPADMGNLGTILRTATAFGIEDIAIISPAADIYDPKVIRSSMGALFHVRFRYYDHFEAYRQEIAAEDGGRRLLFPFMLDGQPIAQAAEGYRLALREGKRPFSLIFGNESSGLPPSFLTQGTPVRILHADTVDSLNLPMAVGIGLYTFTDMNRRGSL